MARVLPLWEAFLIQMDDFDWFLEVELRQMLDPVAASRAPRLRRRKGIGSPLLAVVTAPIERVAAVLPLVEPVAVAVRPIQLIT
ncbi:MAG: hypothetical protein ACYDA0_02730 [Candidatus Dormibacteraceae bacterium]